jgi:hypothetical protein
MPFLARASLHCCVPHTFQPVAGSTEKQALLPATGWGDHPILPCAKTGARCEADMPLHSSPQARTV